jgi:hypothetical protein
MAELPEAKIIIDDQAGAWGTGTDVLTVIGCVEMGDDIVPRIFTSTKALLAKHGYSAAVDYCAMHFEETKKPVLFVPLPIATAGTLGTLDVAGNTGTSTITAGVGPSGALDEVQAQVTVVQGGTIGTDPIVLDISVDGGREVRRVRLGLASSYTAPYLDLTVNFGAGTLITGDVCLRLKTTPPMWDQAGLQAARLALAGQGKRSRSWLIIGDLTASDEASDVVTEINAYATQHDRCSTARVQVWDRASAETDADWISGIDAEFDGISSERRIDLGAGRGRKMSPITGWRLRRPVAWAASIREYQHDVQIPTYRKADGPCSGWTLEDEDGATVEHDDRLDGGLLMARFTCFRSFANGPAGAFIALSLTRADEGSLLSRTHNMAVANLACNVCQAETENAIGQVLELNSDGTGTEASLAIIEARVNSALAISLLQRRAEGPRATAATWEASRADVLNVPGAELNGVLDLRLNGTLEKITTRVRVLTAG